MPRDLSSSSFFLIDSAFPMIAINRKKKNAKELLEVPPCFTVANDGLLILYNVLDSTIKEKSVECTERVSRGEHYY